MALVLGRFGHFQSTAFCVFLWLPWGKPHCSRPAVWLWPGSWPPHLPFVCGFPWRCAQSPVHHPRTAHRACGWAAEGIAVVGVTPWPSRALGLGDGSVADDGEVCRTKSHFSSWCWECCPERHSWLLRMVKAESHPRNVSACIQGGAVLPLN